MGVSKILQQVGIIKPGAVRTAGVSIGSLAMGVEVRAGARAWRGVRDGEPGAAGRRGLGGRGAERPRQPWAAAAETRQPGESVPHPPPPTPKFPGMGTHDDFIARGKRFAEGCRRKRLCFGTLDEDYYAYMDTFLTPNVSEAITGRCGGRAPAGRSRATGNPALFRGPNSPSCPPDHPHTPLSPNPTPQRLHGHLPQHHGATHPPNPSPTHPSTHPPTHPQRLHGHLPKHHGTPCRRLHL
jgi:hypothetical protein